MGLDDLRVVPCSLQGLICDPAGTTAGRRARTPADIELHRAPLCGRVRIVRPSLGRGLALMSAAPTPYGRNPLMVSVWDPPGVIARSHKWERDGRSIRRDRRGRPVCRLTAGDPARSGPDEGLRSRPCAVSQRHRLHTRRAALGGEDPRPPGGAWGTIAGHPGDRPGTIAFDDARVELSDFTELVGAPMLSARRVTLDAILIEAAAAAGTEVRPQTAVTGLIEQRGRVAGVKTKSDELRAPLVVGADGVHSAVARLVGAAKYDQTPAGRIFTWAYFEGAHTDDDHMWLGGIGDHGFLAFPTDAGLLMAAVVPSIHRRDEVLADRQAAFAAELAHWPE